MRRRAGSRLTAAAALILAAAGVLSACSGGQESAAPTSPPATAAPTGSVAPPSQAPSVLPSPASTCAQVDGVTLAVSGPAQAQYAGYLAAAGQGAYAERCLDVTVIDAGEDPLTAITEGRADFAVATLPDGLRARERGIGVVDVAQVFQRSGTVEVSLASAGITQVTDFRGKRVAILRGTDGIEPIAAMSQAGLDPVGDLRVVDDPPAALLLGEVDAAQTTTFDGLAQLAESTNSKTGSPFQLSDFATISFQTEGVGLLPDAVWAAQDRLADPAYQDLTQRFVTGSLAGWISCRDELAACADTVARAGSAATGAGLQWRINQANALIWPSPAGVGVMDSTAADSTVNVLLNTKTLDGVQGLGGAPVPEAWTDQYARAADDALSSAGLNVTGDGYTPADLPIGG